MYGRLYNVNLLEHAAQCETSLTGSTYGMPHTSQALVHKLYSFYLFICNIEKRKCEIMLFEFKLDV